MRLNLRSLPNGQRHHHFIELSTLLTKLVAAEGGSLTPFADASLPHFSKLSTAEQTEVLSRLTDYVLVCEQVIQSGFRVRDSRALTWRMLGHLGLTPLSDAFDTIHSEDLVEIYNERHVQCFASMNFLEAVSYTLEDLYCRPWMNLYSRDDSIAGKIMSELQKILDGSTKGSIVPDVPQHAVNETDSALRLSAIVRPKLFSPLLERSRRAGFMTVNELVEIL